MRTAQRLRLGLTIAVLLVALVGIVSVSSTLGFQRATMRARENGATLLAVNTMLTRVSDAESLVLGYILTGDSAGIKRLDGANARIAMAFDSLSTLTTTNPAQHARVVQLEQLVEHRIDRLRDVVALYKVRGLDAAIELAREGRGRATRDSLRFVATEIQTAASAGLREKQVESARSARLSSIVVGLSSVLALILLSLAAYLMSREFNVRRTAETALRESQAQLTQFLDSLPIGAVVVDATGQTTFANTTALSMFGASSLGDLAHRPGDTLMPLWRGDDHAPLPASEDPMRAALRGLAAQREGLAIHVGETRIPIEISAAPVFDSGGNVAFAIATFSDITERQRARAAMQLARQAAEDSNRAKSDFLARMSHELRTPLISVIGFANILLKNKAGTLRDQDITYLSRILDNGKHLLILINDILDLSKIESGKVQVEWESVDLATILSQTVQQLEPQAKPGVILSSQVPAGLDQIISDSARLRQIAINLLGNALKFTQDGSVTVVVDVEPGTRRPSRIRVIDTGIGIPPDRLNAIFDAFEQAERTTARQYGGTGLGLPISRALCELLGYTLTVKSQVGTGTEFVIDLRAEEKRRATSDIASAASGSDK
jgi:PAS domain S-box-containing protein